MTKKELIQLAFNAEQELNAKGLIRESFYVRLMGKIIEGTFKENSRIYIILHDLFETYQKDPILFEAKIKDFVKNIQSQPQSNKFTFDPEKDLKDFIRVNYENGI